MTAEEHLRDQKKGLQDLSALLYGQILQLLFLVFHPVSYVLLIRQFTEFIQHLREFCFHIFIAELAGSHLLMAAAVVF